MYIIVLFSTKSLLTFQTVNVLILPKKLLAVFGVSYQALNGSRDLQTSNLHEEAWAILSKKDSPLDNRGIKSPFQFRTAYLEGTYINIHLQFIL